MTLSYDIVAMGDVNLDTTVTQFLPYEFRSITSNRLTFTPIEESCGGSGLIFCLRAEDFGCSTLLLSKTGADLTGQKIRADIQGHPLIAFPEQLVSEFPTGHALIVRDQSQVRLLINNDNNANFHLVPQDVERFAGELASCRVLHISGYCINERSMPRFQATIQAMETAREAKNGGKPVIVLDVVPHRIYEKFTFAEFYEITKNADILVSEVSDPAPLPGSWRPFRDPRQGSGL